MNDSTREKRKQMKHRLKELERQRMMKVYHASHQKGLTMFTSRPETVNIPMQTEPAKWSPRDIISRLSMQSKPKTT